MDLGNGKNTQDLVTRSEAQDRKCKTYILETKPETPLLSKFLFWFIIRL